MMHSPGMMTEGAARRGGFTLIELLVAMGLLAGLGLMLTQLVGNAFDLYETGDRTGELYVTAEPVFETLVDDLNAVFPGPEGRLVIEAGVFADGAGMLMRLVRTAPGGEMEHPVLRRAGTSTQPTQSWSGGSPPRAELDAIQPASGLIEVAYALIRAPGDSPGTMTLYRGVRAPILTEQGFFSPAVRDAMDEVWVEENLQPVSTGLLGLWILALPPGGEEADEEAALEGQATPDGLIANWDSTRGLLDAELMPLARGPASALDPEDDVFPREISIVLAMGRNGKGETRLRSSLGPGETRISVQRGKRLALSETNRYIKIGDEWLEVLEGYESNRLEVRRAARGTTQGTVEIDSESAVHSGRSFRSTLRLPAGRNGFRGLSR